MGYGFFSDTELKELKTIKIAGSECGVCGLYRHCISPKMEAIGDGKRGFMIVAETPGEEEDIRGVQLVGECGQFLRLHLYKVGVDLDEDCIKTNAVRCYPANNATLKDTQINACRSKVFEEIRKQNPKVLILLGSIACKSVLSELRNVTSGSVTMWRGYTIPDQTLKCWICPTVHPSYVLREQRNRAVELIFNQDIQRAVEKENIPFPDYSWMLDAYKILTETEAIKLLEDLNKNPKACAFDYETTGKKPHRKGHRIVCLSICFARNISFSFMFTPKLVPYVQRFLSDERIGKIASNKAFEDSWSHVILNTTVKNFIWDTMLNAHVLDNRSAITSIKTQTYIRYGISAYNEKVEKYLTSGDDESDLDSNLFNRIDECDQLELLKYCALDSLFEYNCALDQMQEMCDVPNFI